MYRITLLAFIAVVAAQDKYIVPDGYLVNRVGDFWFEYHDTHGLLLIVGNTCHLITVNKEIDPILVNKADREAFELDIYHNYILKDAHQTPYSYAQLRNEFHDLYANFQCVGKRVYKINYQGFSRTTTATTGPPTMTSTMPLVGPTSG